MSSEWDGYIPAGFSFTAYPPGARVLDVGFGDGGTLRSLAANGARASGIEADPARLAGQPGVARAKAEDLPFAAHSFDGVICKVVVPYTDEARAVAEIARVLRPGGVARVAYHGLGYYLRYLAVGSWKRKVYAVRVVVNTWWYRATGRRLPGFVGDTLYQSRGRLQGYYGRAGLEVVEDVPTREFGGAPVFIYQVLRKKVERA